MPKNKRNNSGGITVISRRRELQDDRLAVALAAYVVYRLNNPATTKRNDKKATA